MKVEEFRNKVNGLANLQLLPGGPNAEKSAATKETPVVTKKKTGVTKKKIQVTDNI